uniref:Immunoglobulin V-set domain-containing protein n=1 Tax=Poecilia formosa TaxID=48698 RepID=A0A096M7N5_POEFO
VHHSLFCLIFVSALQVRSSRSVETHYGVSGGNITFPCSFLSSGKIKIFCRETCEGENILIRTRDDAAQIGRYRTEYEREASRTFPVLQVTITQLTQSDSGRYRCKLDRAIRSDLDRDFSITVTDGSLTWTSSRGLGPNYYFPVPDPSTFTPTATQSFSSTSESFSPAVSSETSSLYVLLMVLSPPFIIVIIALALLLYWRKTTTTAPAEQPEETPEVRMK